MARSTSNALKAIEERRKKQAERKNTNSQTSTSNKSSGVSSGGGETSSKREVSTQNALNTIKKRRENRSEASNTHKPGEDTFRALESNPFDKKTKTSILDENYGMVDFSKRFWSDEVPWSSNYYSNMINDADFEAYVKKGKDRARTNIIPSKDANFDKHTTGNRVVETRNGLDVSMHYDGAGGKVGQMTDDEVDIYSYILAKYGYNQAEEYIRYLDDNLTNRLYEGVKTESNKEEGGKKDSWFKTGDFSDGYDFGDATKTTLGTVGDLGLGAVKGVGRMVEGLVDLGTYGVAGVGGWFSDDFKEKTKKIARYSATDEWTKGATDFLDKHSVLGNKSDGVAEGIGQVLAIMGTAGLAGAAGLSGAGVTAVTTGTMGASSMGTSMGEAYDSGATDLEAVIYGGGKGIVDAGTELVFGGLGKGVKALGISRGIGGLDDIFAKKLSSKLTKSITNEFAQRAVGNAIEIGVKSAGEGLEEVAAGYGSAIMKKLTYMSDEELKQLVEDENLLDQFIVGAVTSSIVQSPSYINSTRTGADFVTGLTPTQEQVVDTLAENEFTERQKGGTKLTGREKNIIYNDLIKNLLEEGSSKSEAQSKNNEPIEGDTLEKAAMDVVNERNAAKTGTSIRERLEAQTQNNEPITVEDVKKATGFGDEGAKIVTELANSDGVTFSQAESTVKTAYLAGSTGIEGTSVNFSTDTQINAFTAGKKDRVMQDMAMQEKAKKATVYEGAFTENEHTKNYTKSEKKMIATVAKVLKMDISATDEILASITYDRNGEEVRHYANAEHNDGKMTIANNRDADKAIYKMIMHEGGHRMRQLAPTEFGVLMDALYKRADGRNLKLGVSRGLKFDKIKSAHDNAGITMDTSGYIEEVAVRELETIFSSEREFNKWYEEISGDKTLRTNFERFVDWVLEVIEDVKRALNNAKLSKTERAEAKKSLAELDRIKGLLESTFKAAENAATERANKVQADQSLETKSGKNLEIKINEEYNGNINHSLYDEYTTRGMQWAYHSDTQVGDRKVLYNSQTDEFVLVVATKEGVGFTEVNSGSYEQMNVEKEYYGKEKQRKQTDGIKETVDKVLRDFGVGRNNNSRNNVNAENRRTGKQYADVSKGKPRSNGTRDFEATARKVNKNFCLKESVEETRNLVAVHNMQLSELERTLDLGGLPMPSIAIIKAQSGHSEYGDVSLVFDKSVIDPKANKNNKVYGGDAWTPTYPTIEYKPNEKLANKISDKYYELSRKFGNDESRPLYNYVYDLERKLNSRNGEAGMINELYEDTQMMQLYLLDSGKDKVETIKKETRTELTDAEVEINEFFIKELGADVVDEVVWDGNGNPMSYRKNYLSKYEESIRDAYKKLLVEEWQFSDEQVQNVLGKLRPVDYLNFVRNANKYRQDGRVTIKTEDDREATNKAIRESAGEGYREWVDSLFKGIEEKSGIRNNADYFTNNGNRRSWEALHWENNLENVVKVMKSQDDVGSAAIFTGHGIWGVSAKDYRSIEEIKADADRLKQLPDEEYNKIKESFGERLHEIAQSIMSKSERNPFIAEDNAMECIIDAVRNSKTKSGILNNLKQYPQLTVTVTTVDDIVSLVNDISNMPTEYFEAKPKRAVGLTEIATAIIPDNISQATKARLDDMGIKYVEYESGNENARLEALNSLEEVKFSLRETDNISTKDRKDLLDIIEHLKGEFELTKFAKADQKKLAKMTRDILKEYSSQANFDETLKAVDDLYTYMANGEDGHSAVWEEVYDRAYNIAQGIVENAVEVDNFAYKEYKHLRDYLRTTPMKFDAEYDSVPSAYENFNEVRKMNMGRLKFTKDGMGIDGVYQELAHLYPEFFDAEEQTNSADQLERIIDVLDELQPTEINPFDREIEQASMYLANDLTSRFFDIPQAKPTFADKAERRVVEAKIKGAKKVEAVRQQKDEKIRKLLESQKNKTKKLLEKAKESKVKAVDKEKAKRKDNLAKMSESQKAKVLRARILRHTSDLNKKLLNPTDNQHIPHELQGAVAKLLECINLESNYTYDTESHSYKKNDEGLPTRRTQAYNELKKVYGDIASSVVIDPDLVGDYGLLSGVISLADKRIVDMTSSELETVWQSIRAIEASVNTANRIFSEGKFATILDIAETLRNDNPGKKSKTEYKGIIGKGKKLATLDMLTPETYLHYLGDAGDSVFRMMRDAQDKHISIMKEVADFTHKELKDVNVNKLEKKLHTVKLGGEDVQLSTAQLMELYVLMKRDQAVDHILVGGILPDVTKSKGLKLITKTKPIRNISVEEISKAISNLTDEQKKVADKLQKYVSSVLSSYGNEASMQVYNYEKFNEENYWTIRTNKQEITSDVEKDTSVTTVANKGMTKATKPHANTSVRIGSIFDTFASHSSDMATYAAWLGTSEDVNRIRNFVFWEDGARTGTVKDILDTVHGTQGSKYLEKLLTDVAIGVKGTDNMNPFDRLIGHYKAASVGANLRVIIQQPTAILRALDMIDARYFITDVKNPLKGWKKAKKYAPIAQWKDWGYFDINTGRQMKDVMFDNASLLEKTKQVGMWGASMADSISWGKLWNAVESETKAKNKELKVGSEEYYETVAKRFTEIVDHTQVVDGILQRSQVMRSADNLTKMATAFMGEPTKQYNMAVAAAYDAINQKGDARKKAVARLGRTAFSLATAGIINACAQSIIDAMRDDDKEEKYWERWLTAFVGDGEDAWFQKLGNIGDTFNPLNYVPYVKDIVSIFLGYDVKRMDMESISKVTKATQNMHKAVTGTGKYTIAEASATLFAEIGRLYGLPVANVKRDIKSLVMATAIETDNYLMQYRIEKAMLDINYAGNSKNFIDILFNAYNNDREAYEFIYNDMIKSGYDAEKIEKGMEERQKKAEGVTEVSDLSKRYVSPEYEQEYDSMLDEVMSTKVWKSASEEQQKDVEADLYEILTSTSETTEETREKLDKYGIDETDYVLWNLAREMADKPSESGKYGSYTNEELAVALSKMNVDDKTAWALYLSGNDTEKAREAKKHGIDAELYAKVTFDMDNISADYIYKGKRVDGKDLTSKERDNAKAVKGSREDKIKKYLNSTCGNKKEYLYFLGSEYKKYQDDRDYVSYFGK